MISHSTNDLVLLVGNGLLITLVSSSHDDTLFLCGEDRGVDCIPIGFYNSCIIIQSIRRHIGDDDQSSFRLTE